MLFLEWRSPCNWKAVTDSIACQYLLPSLLWRIVKADLIQYSAKAADKPAPEDAT